MYLTRRRTLAMGLAAMGAATLMPRIAYTQAVSAPEGDRYETDGGEIVVHPVEHASFVMEAPGMVIYVDPVGGAALYADFPAPDLILVTHEHGDHFDVATLAELVTGDTRLIVNPAVYDMLEGDLQAAASAMANGDSATVGDISIEAVPAYNITADRLQFHPEGRDNGYVLGIGDMRVYIAGDTEDTPEMRALEGIDIAFVPMNLPFTMDVAQAASGVGAFAPDVVYPYHYGESDLDSFENLLREETDAVEVVRGNWYPAR